LKLRLLSNLKVKMDNIKILVSDDVSESGLEPLRSSGMTIDKKTGLGADDLREIIPNYDALIVRSETKVTAALMDEAVRLRVVGRAGVGVDNIDVAAATKRGIIVMNAPDGNTMTTAEHTMALLLALARRVPQGCASLRDGRWERKKFIGTELRGKTLGIVGFGRIGRVVARRAVGFEMNVIAFDPFVAPDQMIDSEVEFDTLEGVCARADFITVHTPLTPETRGIIGAREFSLMKPGARLINCARGGLIDEQSLYSAIKEGKVAGAALDVFEEEPPPANHPLIQLEEVIATPHLGASTREAQEGVAVTVAEQVRDYLLTGALRGAVNVPAIGAQQLAGLQPYMMLAERLGRFQAQLIDTLPVRDVHLEYSGELAEMDAAPVTRAFLAALLRDVSARVNVVNAFIIAEERGIAVTASYTRSAKGENSPAIRTRLTTSEGEQTVSGSLFGTGDARIVEINNFSVEAIPRGFMIVLRNRDVPGVVGQIGTTLGERYINISRFHLGRDERGGEAMAVVETDAPVEAETLEEIRKFEQVLSARYIEFQS
jgi:D-3-phosphoglycerate dehydrogenase / 2-oxoglutarate reductase